MSENKAELKLWIHQEMLKVDRKIDIMERSIESLKEAKKRLGQIFDLVIEK